MKKRQWYNHEVTRIIDIDTWYDTEFTHRQFFYKLKIIKQGITRELVEGFGTKSLPLILDSSLFLWFHKNYLLRQPHYLVLLTSRKDKDEESKFNGQMKFMNFGE